MYYGLCVQFIMVFLYVYFVFLEKVLLAQCSMMEVAIVPLYVL
jgi:hypothetical protein